MILTVLSKIYFFKESLYENVSKHISNDLFLEILQDFVQEWYDNRVLEVVVEEIIDDIEISSL